MWNTSDYYINGALNIAANVYITDELDVAESVSIGTTLNVTGNTTILGTLDAPTLNTGQGDNELYAMNQNVQTSDSVTFDTLSVTNNATVGGSLTLTGEADFNSTMNLQGAMTTQNTIQSDNFDKGTGSTGWLADGATGFAIEDNSGTYDMYVDSLTVRGSLRVFELIAKQISAIGGTEILSVANGVVESSSGSAGSETVTLEDPNNTLATAFADNDLVLVQRFDPNDPSNLIKQEFRTVSVSSGLTLTLTETTSGEGEPSPPAASSAISAGDFIVAYGNTAVGTSRGNIIYRNVEGQPIVRLHAGIDSYADFVNPATTTRIAYGDLNGFSGQGSGTFGFFAGADGGDHVLIKNDGLFFKKDNSTVLAELTSNTFKVGDTTNFLSFNGSAFNIQTNTFDLATSTLVVDSTANKIALGASADSITIDGTEVGFIADGNGEFKAFLDANNFIRLANSSLNIKAEKFNLESSTIQLGDSIELSTSEITTTYDYSGSTLVFSGLFNDTYNYFGYLEDIDDVNPDGYVFRVGDATNFMELNTTNNVAQIKFDTFDLESGNLAIDSGGTTFPSASSSQPSTTSNQTGFSGSSWDSTPLFINDKTTVKFQFDYDITTTGRLGILLKISNDNGSSYTNYSDSSTTAVINMTPEYADNSKSFATTGSPPAERVGFQFSISNQINNRIDALSLDNPPSPGRYRTGTVTVYVYVADIGDADAIRFQVAEIVGSLPVCNATSIITQQFQSVTEINPSGVFTRLSDAVILANGDKYLNPELIT